MSGIEAQVGAAHVEPEDRWETPHRDRPSVYLTGGPERVYDDRPTEDRQRAAGFVRLTRVADPLVWEGDDA